MAVTAVQGQAATSSSSDSLLYALISDDKLVEGPLEPSAYAQTENSGSSNRLAAIGGGPIDDITFADPEVGLSDMLGGNSVISSQNPLNGEPLDIEEAQENPTAPQPTLYTVQTGDTLASIASSFNISLATLTSANGLRENEYINAGDHLTILPVNGVLHSVRSGDTISEIARKYDVGANEIVAYNAVEGDKLKIGQKLIVPGGVMPTPVPVAPRRILADVPVQEPSEPEETPETPSSSGGWKWPTTTKHISQYFKWGHTGVDIDNRNRPAVVASKGGTVKTAKFVGGYGNLVILDHGNGLETYYAHLDKFYVSPGDSVGAGEAVGKMGSTGRSTGPHVHFEVRVNGRPVNPLGYI